MALHRLAAHLLYHEMLRRSGEWGGRHRPPGTPWVTTMRQQTFFAIVYDASDPKGAEASRLLRRQGWVSAVERQNACSTVRSQAQRPSNHQYQFLIIVHSAEKSLGPTCFLSPGDP